MIDFVPRTDASLPEVLAARARSASDLRLVLDAGGGALAVIGILLWRPPGWTLLASAALCFAAFGAWGIADRELRERPAESREVSTRALRAARVLAAIVGGVAAALLLFGMLGVALGTWIS
jgi:hypothetical protein